jgi:hypothetical protein
MSWERFGGLREAIAQLAAQIMYGEDVKQYFTAKRLAAKRLLGRSSSRGQRCRPRDLPSNGEIKQALLELVEDIEGDVRRRRCASGCSAPMRTRATGPRNRCTPPPFQRLTHLVPVGLLMPYSLDKGASFAPGCIALSTNSSFKLIVRRVTPPRRQRRRRRHPLRRRHRLPRRHLRHDRHRCRCAVLRRRRP